MPMKMMELLILDAMNLRKEGKFEESRSLLNQVLADGTLKAKAHLQNCMVL